MIMAQATITTYRRATSEMGQLWAGTTLGWDNFDLGHFCVGQLWAGTTLIWDNFGLGNFGRGNNEWNNFDM